MSKWTLVWIRTPATLAAVVLLSLTVGLNAWLAVGLALSITVALDAHFALMVRGAYTPQPGAHRTERKTDGD